MRVRVGRDDRQSVSAFNASSKIHYGACALPTRGGCSALWMSSALSLVTYVRNNGGHMQFTTMDPCGEQYSGVRGGEGVSAGGLVVKP